MKTVECFALLEQEIVQITVLGIGWGEELENVNF